MVTNHRRQWCSGGWPDRRGSGFEFCWGMNKGTSRSKCLVTQISNGPAFRCTTCTTGDEIDQTAFPSLLHPLVPLGWCREGIRAICQFVGFPEGSIAVPVHVPCAGSMTKVPWKPQKRFVCFLTGLQLHRPGCPGSHYADQASHNSENCLPLFSDCCTRDILGHELGVRHHWRCLPSGREEMAIIERFCNL